MEGGVLRQVKITATITALVALLTINLSACRGSSGASGDGTELDLVVPSYSDATKPYWENLIKDFQAANPGISVKLEMSTWADIQKIVDTRIQANKAPDILELDAAGPTYGKEGLLYKADEILSPETLADIVPSFLSSAAIDGVNYGVPTVASTRALFYNVEWFIHAGITNPPKTWDELLAAAKKISALGIPGYGMPLGGEEAQAESSIWAYGAGASWGDSTRLTVNTPEATQAFSFVRKMIDEKATQPDPGATNRTPLLNAFIQGQVGMIEGLPPLVGQIRDKNPSLQWATAPSPTRDGRRVTLGVADYFVAFKKETTKQAAIRKFLDFFYRKDNYVKFNDNEGFVPATKSGATAAAAKPELRTFLEALPTAKFYPASNPKWADAKGAFQELAGLIQRKPATEVLKQMQAKVDAG